MIKKIILTLILLVSFTFAEEKIDPKEAFFLKALVLTEKLAEVLETAKSSKNYEAAATRIEQLVPVALDIKKKARESGMNNLRKEDEKKLVEKYKKRIFEASSKVIKLSMELKDNPVITKAIIKIKKAMN